MEEGVINTHACDGFSSILHGRLKKGLERAGRTLAATTCDKADGMVHISSISGAAATTRALRRLGHIRLAHSNQHAILGHGVFGRFGASWKSAKTRFFDCCSHTTSSHYSLSGYYMRKAQVLGGTGQTTGGYLTSTALGHRLLERGVVLRAYP